MKVIPLYHHEKKLIKKACKHDRMAQEVIYKRYSPKMLSVCRMYVSDLQFAEDVMLKGFFKVFHNLHRFAFKGSFEGWIRKIMVHEAIDFLRSQKQVSFSEELERVPPLSTTDYTGSFEVDYLQKLIDELPEGYRIVFIMAAVEGYKHKEIATLLGISVGTSKSQLSKARKLLQQKLIDNKKDHEMEGMGN